MTTKALDTKLSEPQATNIERGVRKLVQSPRSTSHHVMHLCKPRVLSPLRSICVIYVLCLSCFRVCSLLPCGHLLGKGWPLGSRLLCLFVFLSLSHVVSWVRCGTWLYRFLIFATFLTFSTLGLRRYMSCS